MPESRSENEPADHTLVLPFYFDAFRGEDLSPKTLNLWAGPPIAQDDPLVLGQPPYPPPPGRKRYGFRLVLEDWRQPEPTGDQDLGAVEVEELPDAAQGQEEGRPVPQQGGGPGELEQAVQGTPPQEDGQEEEGGQA